MVWPPLTKDGDLQHFPGAPYPLAVVRAAEASVRSDAGWHVAPVFRETVTVTGTGRGKLFLPSRRVVTVHSVLADTVPPVAVTGWHLQVRGVLLVPFGQVWADGVDYLVDLTHGFEYADDLLPVVAGRCQRQLADALLTQRSETVGTKTTSESYNARRLDPADAGEPALARYRLPTVA